MQQNICLIGNSHVGLTYCTEEDTGFHLKFKKEEIY
jgi:hypothetical protein